MYEVHFRRHMCNKHDKIVIKKDCSNLQEAKEARRVSGDLVVYADSHKVVENFAWLWDFELRDPKSWARLAIERGY